ncbi:MAG: hypothetical protein RIS92_3019 [Verrucomicrobiota bacterium]
MGVPAEWAGLSATDLLGYRSGGELRLRYRRGGLAPRKDHHPAGGVWGQGGRRGRLRNRRVRSEGCGSLSTIRRGVGEILSNVRCRETRGKSL